MTSTSLKIQLNQTEVQNSASWRELWLLAPLLLSALLGLKAQAASSDPHSLIRQSDLSRGGSESGLTWTAEVASTEDGDTTTRTYQIKARGPQALVETLTPAKNKGELMLFTEQNLWFSRQGLRKPVTLSKRQKLSGQAANGDIAATDYAAHYTASIEGEESIGGEVAYRLILKSKDASTTYDQIRYWVSKSRKVALKADFLTLQGEIFKTATFTYEARLSIDGKEVPFITEMKIQDGQFKENQSVIRYREVKAKPLAASTFAVANLSL